MAVLFWCIALAVLLCTNFPEPGFPAYWKFPSSFLRFSIRHVAFISHHHMALTQASRLGCLLVPAAQGFPRGPFLKALVPSLHASFSATRAACNVTASQQSLKNCHVACSSDSTAFSPPSREYRSHSEQRRTSSRSVQTRAMASSADPSLPSLGFLGLGIMGTAMAANLVKAGYSVTVWNRSPAKCQPLVELGALQQSSPQDVTKSCDITFAMLADPEGAMEVACGEKGAVKGLGPGKGYVDVSTVDGLTAISISQAVRETGALYLEAPVSGSKKPAEDGTLIFLTAGDKSLFDQASPAFDVMGKSKFFLGEVGKGANMKLVVNMVMGSMMASFSEGIALGSKAGLEESTILEVVRQGAIAAPMFAMKGPTMLKGAFPPAFPLKHQQKDLRLALALGNEVGQDLPLAFAANEVFVKAKEAGLGDNDFSAVFEVAKGSKN